MSPNHRPPAFAPGQIRPNNRAKPMMLHKEAARARKAYSWVRMVGLQVSGRTVRGLLLENENGHNQAGHEDSQGEPHDLEPAFHAGVLCGPADRILAVEVRSVHRSVSFTEGNSWR